LFFLRAKAPGRRSKVLLGALPVQAEAPGFPFLDLARSFGPADRFEDHESIRRAQSSTSMQNIQGYKYTQPGMNDAAARKIRPHQHSSPSQKMRNKKIKIIFVRLAGRAKI